MKFLLDANMPRTALTVLRARGHVVDHVRDCGLGDASDQRIAACAVETDAVLVSRDLDFADIRRFPPQSTQGILVLRVADASRAEEIADILARFLTTDLVSHLPGHLVILESDRVRFRPPLGG